MKWVPLFQAEGASDEPCSEIYCGAFPESEPETQSVAHFLRSHKDSVKLYITIHSYSQMLLFPYSYTVDEAENHNEMVSGSLSTRSKMDVEGQGELGGGGSFTMRAVQVLFFSKYLWMNVHFQSSRWPKKLPRK